MTTSHELKRTPFHQNHVNMGGKMVEFGGWEMPVQYSSITQEHTAVRTNAGLFDISHMGQVFVWGTDAEAYLQNLVTNDVRKAVLSKGIYAHLLNEKGGVIDDIFIYRLEPEKFLVIVNASRFDVDYAWMKKHKSGDVTILEAPFGAGWAIQGPNASQLLAKFASDIPSLPRFGIAEYPLNDLGILVARTGYTGEDGFELFAPAGHLLQLWDDIFKAGKELGLQPCGLGARDTLRTEVAYPLYGHELDENRTPFQARLSWVVKMDKGDFIGRAALVERKAQGFPDQLYGFKVIAGGIARPGGVISINGKEVSTVASGTFSPTLGQAIGMAYLPTGTKDEGQIFNIKQGTRDMEAVTVKMPFYRPEIKNIH